MTLASSSPIPQELGTLRNPDTGDISHSFIHEHYDPFTCCIYTGLDPQVKRDASLGWGQSRGFYLHSPLLGLSARAETVSVRITVFRDPKPRVLLTHLSHHVVCPDSWMACPSLAERGTVPWQWAQSPFL